MNLLNQGIVVVVLNWCVAALADEVKNIDPPTRPVASASSLVSSLTSSNNNAPVTEPVERSGSSSAANNRSSALPSADYPLPGPASVEIQPTRESADRAPVSSAGSRATENNSAAQESSKESNPSPAAVTGSEKPPLFVSPKFILDTEVKPGTSVRLTWNSESVVGGFTEATPVMVVNGVTPGKTLCLTGAIHGDELNGIEMIRRVIFDLDPEKLTGTVIGVPVANIMGFRRNSRYLPDRRDWNRYFPGNTRGSSASRLAYSFFTKVIVHCDALIDIHTGSFHRSNLPQLRADLADEKVAQLAQGFGSIAVLNSRGNPNSLRAAAVRAGIPAITLEAGEPMAMQSSVVDEGTAVINTLLSKMGMYGTQRRWNRIAPVYYKSSWVRANQSGILFSKVTLGERIAQGEILGTVTDPITNARSSIISPYTGRILGMALDQVVLPGFAAYHIGIQTPEAILIEESQVDDGTLEEDEEDGDDAGIAPPDAIEEPQTPNS